MTKLPHNTQCHCSLMRPLRPRHAFIPMALFLSLWFSFSVPAMAVQATTPSKSTTAAPSTIADENATEEDDPDANLVPLDTEGPPPEASSPSKATTSMVPRTEDLIQLNPAGNSPATVRFSDALNPPAELTQMQDPSRSAAAQTEYTSYN